MTPEKITSQLVLDFAAAIDAGSEQVIHSFIQDNPHILDFVCWDGLLRSKFRLADAFIPDFLAIGIVPWSNRLMPLVTFVEIERANEALFTKAGDPTAFLTHAIRQVYDWQQWVLDNRSYVQKLIHREIKSEQTVNESIGRVQRVWDRRLDDDADLRFEDRYLIIAGRREGMTASDAVRLFQLEQSAKALKIMTYDAILEGLFRSLERRDRHQW